MKNKAFTLIELLAVIVVLGIIMLIAVTAVSNVISNSKTNSFKNSAMLVAKQIRQDLISSGETPNTIDCMNATYGLNPNNYDTCTASMYYESDKVTVSVDLIGKGNFQGYTIIGATMNGGSVINTTTYPILKTTLLATVGTKDVDVNKYNGNGLYKWGSKYIFRGGLTKTNSNGLTTGDYSTDVDSGSEPNNYVKVPWETYSVGETCTDVNNNKCWRVISINPDGSIIIVKDKRESSQIFDNTTNSAAQTYFNNYTNTYGYNDLLENVPSSGHPEEYRSVSNVYTYLYGLSGYQNTILKDYYYLLQPFDICLNKVNSYSGINLSTYSSTTNVIDTCNVSGKVNTLAVNSIRNKYVRLPYMEEYLNASLESTCNQDGQYQCRNQNFMYIRSYYWSLNGSFTRNWNLRSIHIYGSADTRYPYYSVGIKPLVTLKSSILITGGTGTTSDPYVIKS